MDFSLLAGFDYTVIGDPVEHSVSPPMQNAAFVRRGMGSPYTKFRVPTENLPEFTAYAAKHLRGFNVTVPNKQAVIPFLDEITEAARQAQSVNTVTVKDGRLHGDSTDGYGLETALLEAFKLKVPGARICFIGCGGAVQAAAYHFALAGAAKLCFINRTVAKAEELAAGLKRYRPSLDMGCCGNDDREMIAEFLRDAAVVIQGSSLGLRPDDPCPVDPSLLPDGICCYDTIYKNTLFLRAARERGLQTADGRTMLLHQGAKAFEIWTGRQPDIEAMREALNQALSAK